MSKLPAFDDWRWPWDKGSVDEEKAARLIYNARKAEEAALEKVKSKDEEIAQLTTDLDTEKAAKSGTDEDAQVEIKELRKKNRELETAKAQPDPAMTRENAQLKVALKYGLSESASKRLVGETLDEIDADAVAYAEENGIELPGKDGAGDDAPRSRPDPTGKFRTGNRHADNAVEPTDIEELINGMSDLNL